MTLPRIQTEYSLHRSASGRLASGTDDTEAEKKARGKRQLQNVPKKLRDAIVPDPGYVMVGGDWAAIEWAIAMWHASKFSGAKWRNEMLDAFFAAELDPHRLLAAEAYDVSEADVKGWQRQNCKSYTHGYAFGGTYRTLAQEAGHTHKTGLRVCSAHDRVYQLQDFRDQTVRLAKRRRYVQTPLGWRRFFWEYQPKPTEILGTIVQATAADLCKYVLLDVFHTAEFEILTSTHDSIMGQVEDDGKWSPKNAKTWLLDKMQQPIPWLDNRQWRADVQIGNSWRAVS